MRTGLARIIADVLRPSSVQQGDTEVDVHELLTQTLSNQFYGEFRRVDFHRLI